MVGVVVDANCYKGYVDELVNNIAILYKPAFDHIFSTTHIACDDERLILSEWIGCCNYAGEYAEQEVERLLLEDRIKLYRFARDAHSRKFLIQAGIPRRDARMVEFSIGISSKIVVSEDIDLYDPKSKGCDPGRHHRLVFERRGSVCGLLKKKFGIDIICPRHVSDFI